MKYVIILGILAVVNIGSYFFGLATGLGEYANFHYILGVISMAVAFLVEELWPKKVPEKKKPFCTIEEYVKCRRG